MVFISKRVRSLPGVRQLAEQLAVARSAQPAMVIEDSLLLRILTQCMVIAGIIATDVAAETQMSIWAIPLSILGGYWSWAHRRKRNVVIKFVIALGMLLSLAAFFMGLREQLNDTRLVLAELLIQVQILHSFHMPRRQDLGYSMVIGLILIGVASTLSQTMVFGAVLLLFLAISLPVLVLDYRSRLELTNDNPQTQSLRAPGLSIRQLSKFLVVVVALGLALFLIMPRLPGYRLRALPVSAPIEQEFADNQQILNPGYSSGGNPTEQPGEGRGEGEGFAPGEMDDTFYYGFNTRMNQNLRGELTPKVVLRVRSQSAGFWRVQGFDRYLGQGWEVSRNAKTETLLRSRWSYQFQLPRPITVNRFQEIIQTYTAAAELPNIIPVLTQPKELYFPTPQIALDPEGSLRSPLLLPEGLTYTVISEVPYRNRSRLQKAATGNYRPDIRAIYLNTNLPPQLQQKVRKETERLLATSENKLTNPYDKALFLAQLLKQRYRIQPDLPYLNPKEDLVEAFLFKFNGGYPDHFSTALTVMLRSIGVPARLVVGFGAGEFNPFTGLYEVRNTDAYAITEVYFPKFGWFAFDPIPGHELIPPSIEEDQTFNTLEQFWKWVAGWLPSPVSNAVGRFFGWLFGLLGGWLAWLLGLFSQGWVGWFTALALALLTGFAGWLGWQGWRGFRYQRWLASLPPMARAYQRMLDWLAHKGMGRVVTQTPYEYGRAVTMHESEEEADAIATITQAYVQWRYGGLSPDWAQVYDALKRLRKTTHNRISPKTVAFDRKKYREPNSRSE
jgi:protein-glutamine gamma-glutamyltransferase